MTLETFDQLEEYFCEYWEKEKHFTVMPNTARARAYLEKIIQDIPIDRILDNDERMNDTDFGGIPINYAPAVLKGDEKKKILVSAHYAEISKQLDSLGYCENIDYIDMHAFVSMWYWRKRKEIHLLDVHTAITTYCSLNCKACNMFLSHYPKEVRKHISQEEFQENFDGLFEIVDYCYKVTILGGEPLLNRQLPQMLLWLYQNYGEKIGIVRIVTNGTIPPSSELMKAVKRTNAICEVSDYSENVPYEEQLRKTIEVLETNQIRYDINKELKWKDFFFPEKAQQVQFSTERSHMLCCNPVFRGLNDKKFYYCHIVWSAAQAGIWEEKDGDYVALDGSACEMKKQQLLEHDLGFVGGEYISLCKVCGGCGVDNTYFIEAGIQE